VVMMAAGEHTLLVHQSSLAVLPARHLGASRGNGQRTENFGHQYLRCVNSLTCRKILQSGAF
jgi:hypothetical protein